MERRVAFCETKFLTAGIGERQVKAVITSAATDRMGDVVEPAGLDTRQYLRNPVVLLHHDATMPVARCIHLALTSGRIEAVAQFPEPGMDEVADRTYNQVRAGLLAATSIGFRVIEATPIHASGGLRITKSELMEWSFVTVPAQPDALVTAKSARDAELAALRKEIALHRKSDALRFQLELEAMEKRLRAELIGRH